MHSKKVGFEGYVDCLKCLKICCGRCVIVLWSVLITSLCIVFQQADCVSSFYYQIHSFSHNFIHMLTAVSLRSPTLPLLLSVLPGEQLCSSVLGSDFQWRVSTQIHYFLVWIISCGPS